MALCNAYSGLLRRGPGGGLDIQACDWIRLLHILKSVDPFKEKTVLHVYTVVNKIPKYKMLFLLPRGHDLVH